MLNFVKFHSGTSTQTLRLTLTCSVIQLSVDTYTQTKCVLIMRSRVIKNINECVNVI